MIQYNTCVGLIVLARIFIAGHQIDEQIIRGAPQKPTPLHTIKISMIRFSSVKLSSTWVHDANIRLFIQLNCHTEVGPWREWETKPTKDEENPWNSKISGSAIKGNISNLLYSRTSILLNHGDWRVFYPPFLDSFHECAQTALHHCLCYVGSCCLVKHKTNQTPGTDQGWKTPQQEEEHTRQKNRKNKIILKENNNNEE